VYADHPLQRVVGVHKGWSVDAGTLSRAKSVEDQPGEVLGMGVVRIGIGVADQVVDGDVSAHDPDRMRAVEQDGHVAPECGGDSRGGGAQIEFGGRERAFHHEMLELIDGDGKI